MVKDVFLWEVKCVGAHKYTKDFGYGIHRTYYRKYVIKELCKVFAKQADALAYLYTLKQQGYRASYIKKFYGG